MQVVVQSRQSLIDIAIQVCGSADAAFALAEKNDISITDDLIPGQVLEYTPEMIINKRAATALSTKRYNPATALTDQDNAVSPFEGVDFEAVEIDLIVY